MTGRNDEMGMKHGNALPKQATRMPFDLRISHSPDYLSHTLQEQARPSCSSTTTNLQHSEKTQPIRVLLLRRRGELFGHSSSSAVMTSSHFPGLGNKCERNLQLDPAIFVKAKQYSRLSLLVAWKMHCPWSRGGKEQKETKGTKGRLIQ